MRIIGGIFGGRRFHPPAKKWPTRPTTDIAREALFNILDNRLDYERVRMLDLFGGTGAHSIEMISRGCKHVTYIDSFRDCTLFVKSLATELHCLDSITIIRGDVKKWVSRLETSFDYIFAGPPYPLPWIETIPQLIFDHQLLSPEGLFVLETDPSYDFSRHPGFEELRQYGQTHFWFFRGQAH